MAVRTVITMLMIRLQNMFLFSAIIVKILGLVFCGWLQRYMGTGPL